MHTLGQDIVVGWDERYMVGDSADCAMGDGNGEDGDTFGGTNGRVDAVSGSVCQAPQEMVVGVCESGSVYAVVAAERMV
jgi:hypothetical protein